MARTHTYRVAISWAGNLGTGTSAYREYSRDHVVEAPGQPSILASSDPAFRGDPTRWNPEQLLVAAISQCHMLWYLHLCATAGVIVIEYADEPVGTMVEEPSGAGQFTDVVLNPRILLAEPSMVARATELHEKAHDLCFISRSVSFPIRIEPAISSRS